MTDFIKRSLIILLLCCISSWVNASVPYNEWWTKANSFYNQKSYDSAAYYYEKIAAQQPANAEVYYNLGNTYYRLNKIGLSVLNYKRVLRIAPNNANAMDNLLLAQSRMTKKPEFSRDIFFIKWWNALTSPATSQILAVLSYSLFLAILVLFFLKIWKKYTIHSGVFYSLIFLFALVMTGAVAGAEKRNAHSEAVVVQSDAVFKTDLKSGKPELLPEGTIVKWNEAQNDQVLIRLPDGRDGWVNISALEKI